MKIYVGTYGKYNEGNLDGKWLDLEDYENEDEFLEACRELHADEEDPEFMYQDWEDIPDALIDESYLTPQIWDFVRMIRECGNDTDRKEALRTFADYFGAEAVEDFDERYCGKYDSETAYAEEIVRECYFEELSEFAQTYFDYEKYARDLFMCDYLYENGYVFRRY